jgi:FkbM family methyltransferase
MKTVALRNDYFSGKLSKNDYIEEIFKFHSVLMEYPQFIKETNISKLEIVDGHLIATTRDRGIRMICNSSDKRQIPFETMNFGGYEQEEVAIILKLLKCSASTTFFDIGANIGYISMCVAKTFPTMNVYSFEPIPSTYEQFCANIKLNALDAIRPFNHGLSNQTGVVDFFFYPEGSVNASLQQLVDVASLVKIEANVKKMDEVVGDLKAYPDFIKCDVEGAELLVFQGGQQVLKTAQPIVYTEMLRKWAKKFNYHPNDIIQLFHDLSYDCFVIHDGKLLPFQSVNETTEETNYVFLHMLKHAQLKNRMNQ